MVFRGYSGIAPALLALTVCALPARAAPAADKAHVIDLPHAAWTAREGAPSNITGIAQTADGWLWIGSTAGLYRFDGMRFLRANGAQAPLSSNVAGIGVLADGLMWVGYKDGGVSLLAQGRMRHYPPGEDGGPAGTVFDAARDAAGRLWLATGRGLLVLGADGRWRPSEPSLGAPDSAFSSVRTDRDGTLWAAGTHGVFALPRGAARFDRRAPFSTLLPLVRHPDGGIWASDETRPDLRMLLGPARAPAPAWDVPRGCTLCRRPWRRTGAGACGSAPSATTSPCWTAAACSATAARTASRSAPSSRSSPRTPAPGWAAKMG